MVQQSEFLHALKLPELPAPIGLIDGEGHAAGKRFNVYRNNVAVALTEALESGFPVIRKLIGDENFKKVAALFWREHPPQSPVLAGYGASLPAFLVKFEPLAKYPYLADVARLELALRESYHEADSQPIDPNALAGLSPEVLTNARLKLAPSLRSLSSPYPIFSIWAFNMQSDAPKPAARAEDVVVLRAAFDPVPYRLKEGAYAALCSLIAGETLGEAHEAGLAAAPEFDLGGLLSLLLQGNSITEITIAEASG